MMALMRPSLLLSCDKGELTDKWELVIYRYTVDIDIDKANYGNL